MWSTSVPPAHPHQVGSLPHELLSWLFPDGRHCQHPAHSVLLEHAGALLSQLLQWRRGYGGGTVRRELA